MEFLNAAADWADRAAVVVTFERDEKDGWFAKVCFSDARGPYSRHVDLIEPTIVVDEQTGKFRRETPEEYTTRVERLMNLACVNAHKSRQPKLRVV